MIDGAPIGPPVLAFTTPIANSEYSETFSIPTSMERPKPIDLTHAAEIEAEIRSEHAPFRRFKRLLILASLYAVVWALTADDVGDAMKSLVRYFSMLAILFMALDEYERRMNRRLRHVLDLVKQSPK